MAASFPSRPVRYAERATSIWTRTRTKPQAGTDLRKARWERHVGLIRLLIGVALAYQIPVMLFVYAGGFVDIYRLFGFAWNERSVSAIRLHTLVSWIVVETPLIIALLWLWLSRRSRWTATES